MTGKVFKDSVNIYQDQAKVLFDYYRRAAEKIVNEEKELEAKQDEANAAVENAQNDQKKNKIIAIVCCVAGIALAFVVGVTGMVVGLAAGGFFLYKWYAGKKTIAEDQQKITAYKSAYQDIRRDYKVSKLGVAYVPVALRVPSGDRSFLVDYSGTVPNTNFSLSVLHQPQEFTDEVRNLAESMQQIPIVEKNDSPEQIDTADYSTSIQNVTLHDYVGNIDRRVRSIGYLLDDSENVSVDLPVIMPGSKQDMFLQEYASNETEDKPVIPVFEHERQESKLERFSSLGDLDRSVSSGAGPSTDELKNVMKQLAQSVQLLTKSKTSSVNALLAYSSSIFATVLKSPYNQYSPVLEAEEIERIRTITFNYNDEANDYVPFHLKQSSMVRYDLFGKVWVAEDGSRTSMPFGMHEIDEEIFMPVINNLMQENRVERLRIYNGIKDQKIKYLNEWHREIEDFFGRNRKEANEIIQQMNKTHAQYLEAYSNYQQQKATLDTMKASHNINDTEVKEAENFTEVAASFSLQAQQCQTKKEEFAAFMDRIRDDIDESSERFSHIEFFEASLRDSVSHNSAVAMTELATLDERRRKLAEISPYLAKFSELPPKPQTSEEMMEDFRLDVAQQANAMIQELDTDSDAEAKA